MSRSKRKTFSSQLNCDFEIETRVHRVVDKHLVTFRNTEVFVGKFVSD